jgi:hypothetical protein
MKAREALEIVDAGHTPDGGVKGQHARYVRALAILRALVNIAEAEGPGVDQLERWRALRKLESGDGEVGSGK